MTLATTTEFQLLNLNDIDMAELEIKLEEIRAVTGYK